MQSKPIYAFILDFFIDKFQIPVVKSYGADAVLIILAAVTEKTANQLYEDALKLNMSVIVEVHTKEEAKNSIKFKMGKSAFLVKKKRI